MKKTNLSKMLFWSFLNLAAVTESANASGITETTAAKIAKAYLLGVDRNIEVAMDDTLDSYLSQPYRTGELYEFTVQDSSGDCGFSVFVKIATGEIDLTKTKTDWSCI